MCGVTGEGLGDVESATYSCRDTERYAESDRCDGYLSDSGNYNTVQFSSSDLAQYLYHDGRKVRYSRLCY
jgi:hypothetical protein